MLLDTPKLVELEEGVDALEYWRERRRRLGWHRVGARREADRMIAAWERRVRSAVLRAGGLPFDRRLEAGLRVVRARAGMALRRWRRTASLAGVAAASAFGAGFALISSIG